ncbi:MAG: hypothetical protein SNJ55_11185 [Chloroherpetonaceae bacterium]
MKTLKVQKTGLLIPKRFLKNADKVQVLEENGKIIITPILNNDAILNLGKRPIHMGIQDASTNLDRYLYEAK